ncbi:Glycyl-glycine endopeptidase LytM [Anaerolineales bacterium]|nr:Glycyl-glycine endopeptidase LytM [Anaerolineales bacterium]
MKFKTTFKSILSLLLLSSCSQFAGGLNPTPVVAAVADQQAPVEVKVTPSPAPFQFNLPTPGAEPVSGWRPPLYPIPWAMSSFDHFYFARPINADQVNWPLADYRYGGIFFDGIVHTGIDIDAEEEAPIVAASPGTIVWVGWGLFTETPGNEKDPYGLAVVVRHDFGYKDQKLYTVYAHMSKTIATIGQHVETGDLIGLVGATGATTGPHVHFEVRLGENSFHHTLNPELWIAPPQGWGVLAGRVMDTKGDPISHKEVDVASEETKKHYIVKTYGSGGAANPDPYYHENFVLGDLPAGIYKVLIKYEKDKRPAQTWVEIFPGQISYLTFKGEKGFSSERPPAPKLKSLPELPSTPTPLP